MKIYFRKLQMHTSKTKKKKKKRMSASSIVWIISISVICIPEKWLWFEKQNPICKLLSHFKCVCISIGSKAISMLIHDFIIVSFVTKRAIAAAVAAENLKFSRSHCVCVCMWFNCERVRFCLHDKISIS